MPMNKPPMKKSLAMSYAQKRSSKKAYGGNVYGENMSAEDNQSVKDCEACSMATGGKCMSHGGMAENEGAKPDHSSHDVKPLLPAHEQIQMKQKYAEGGKVNDMRPLQQDPSNDNLELDEQEDVNNRSHIDPGISQVEDSSQEQDLPRASHALDLVTDILMDRRRRKMAEGGRVRANMLDTGDGEAMDVGSLHGSIDHPDMSDLSNDGDELDAPVEDGRESRGLNAEPVHTMEDDEHDQSDASLVSQILKDRKMRRRG